MSTQDNLTPTWRPYVDQVVQNLLPVWQVQRIDPGYLYVIEDKERLKIGKTLSTKARLKAAKT